MIAAPMIAPTMLPEPPERLDGVHFIALAGGGLADAETGGHGNAGDRGHQAGQGIDQALDAVDADAGDARALFIAADGVDPAADDGDRKSVV